MTRLGRSELTHGEILSVDELMDRVNEVSKKQIKELANKLFVKERMVLTIIGPIKEKDLTFGLA